MLTDFVDLQDFYQSRLGRKAQDLLRAHIEKMCPDLSKERVLPLGCAGLLLGNQTVVSAHMMTAQGDTFSCLVDSRNKPLPDADIDFVITLHAAETPHETALMLRDIWRILKGEGRVVMIVPRAHSAWADNPDTPFCREPAYSASQIRKVLNDHGFFVTRTHRALYVPPSESESLLSFACSIEKGAPYVLLHLGGGVFVVEAQKRIYALTGKKEQTRENCVDPFLPSPLPI